MKDIINKKLNYLLGMFNFILYECKGDIFNPKDEEQIFNNLNFIAEHGADEQIKETYILLMCVYKQAIGLGLSSHPKFDKFCREFFKLQPIKCQKVRQMIEEDIARRQGLASSIILVP